MQVIYRKIISDTLRESRMDENRLASLADLVPILKNIWGWD